MPSKKAQSPAASPFSSRLKTKDTTFVTYNELLNKLDYTAECHVVFDIETAPIPHDQLLDMFDKSKVKVPEHPGTFNPNKVAYGNRTKPESRRAWLMECQKKHVMKVNEYPDLCNEAIDKEFEKFCKDAPLHAHTG
jgi:hypothetical protein